MGIFSSEDKAYFGTSVTRVVADDEIISSVEVGTLKSLFSKDEISDCIGEEMLESLAIRTRRYYKYAKEHYIYGLPSGQVLNPTQGTPLVETILTDLEGGAVIMYHSFFSVINFPHLAQSLADTAYDYRAESNTFQTLTNAKGYPVYLDYLTLTMTRDMHTSLVTESYKGWGVNVRIVFDAAATTIKARLHYRWSVPNGTDGEGNTLYLNYTESVLLTNDLTIPGLDLKAEYFHAKYAIGGQTKYWQYKAGTGTYPTLDAFVLAEQIPSGSYLPFTLFRTGKVSMDAYVGQPIYETSKNLVKKLGMDYDELVHSINSNPDIGNVEQAILIMGIPGYSTNQAERAYLYRYFDSNFMAMNGQITALSNAEFSNSFGPGYVSGSAIMISDGYFGMALSYAGLYKRLVTGVVAPVGEYSSGVGEVSYPENYTSEDGFPYTKNVAYASHLYRKQVTATQYQEIQVIGLRTAYHLYGMEIAGSGGSGVRSFHNLGDDLTNQPLLILPIDFSVSNGMSVLLREELYARSLHFVFNSITIVHVKWYQQTWFKFVMIIVAVVILIFSWGTEWETLIWALSLGIGYGAAVVLAILIEVSMFLAAQYMVKLFVRKVGIEFAFALAVIAMAYGVATQYGMSNLPVSLSTNLLQLSTGLMSGVSANLEDAMEGVKDEAAVAKAEQDKQWALIDKAEELMDSPKLAPYIFFGESVDTYLNRTAHSGNIGIIGLSAVSNYVERSLSLPTLPEQFGGYST